MMIWICWIMFGFSHFNNGQRTGNGMRAPSVLVLAEGAHDRWRPSLHVAALNILALFITRIIYSKNKHMDSYLCGVTFFTGIHLKVHYDFFHCVE